MIIQKFDRAWVNYNIIKEIGRDGQNSVTYIIHDTNLDEQLVLKRIVKSKLHKDAYFSEAQHLLKSAHDHVAPIRYALEDTDHVFIGMPYFARGSVKDLMRRRHPTVREVIDLGVQVLAGLQHIHSKGIIHFDIKPDNILVKDNGEVMLADFGLARLMNAGGEAEPDTFYGKHTPPEDSIRPRKLTKRCDIFQFGLTLYRMCNGNDAFYGQLSKITPWPIPDQLHRGRFKHAVINGQFPDRRTFLQHIPIALRRVIVKCLEVDPHKRYQSALEVSNALAGIDGAGLDWNYEDNNGIIAVPFKLVRTFGTIPEQRWRAEHFGRSRCLVAWQHHRGEPANERAA